MSERQASTYRQATFTRAHTSALAILSENHVQYLAESRLFAFGHFDAQGRPVAYTVDILVNDTNFGAGVIEIDGGIHNKGNHPAEDGIRNNRLKKLGLWVEHINNAAIGTIMQVLEKHRVKIDAYGGRS